MNFGKFFLPSERNLVFLFRITELGLLASNIRLNEDFSFVWPTLHLRIFVYIGWKANNRCMAF